MSKTTGTVNPYGAPGDDKYDPYGYTPTEYAPGEPAMSGDGGGTQGIYQQMPGANTFFGGFVPFANFLNATQTSRTNTVPTQGLSLGDQLYQSAQQQQQVGDTPASRPETAATAAAQRRRRIAGNLYGDTGD